MDPRRANIRGHLGATDRAVRVDDAGAGGLLEVELEAVAAPADTMHNVHGSDHVSGIFQRPPNISSKKRR